MKVKSIRIRRFRCLKDVSINLSDITTLVGRNGAGKSSFLRALAAFYEVGGQIDGEDFYAHNEEEPIEIAVTFHALREREQTVFAPYLDGEELTVVKVIQPPGGRGNERYYGSKKQFPAFAELRKLGKRNLIDEYNKLVEEGTHKGLDEKVRSSEDAEGHMQRWESHHPDLCEAVRDEGQFFGFTNVGVGKLDQYTRFVYVPAVREASAEAVDSRASALKELMDLVAREAIARDPELLELQSEVQRKYMELVKLDRFPELKQLEGELSACLSQYAANSGVILSWSERAAPEIALPTVSVSLIEDDFAGDVSTKGHGLQRLFILAILQHLASVRAWMAGGNESQSRSEDLEEKVSLGPDLLIGIEEPEIYQHPGRQRRLLKTLAGLARESKNDAGSRLQFVFSTHSPQMVDITRFGDVRVVRKIPGTGRQEPSESMVSQGDYGRVIAELEKAHGAQEGQFTEEGLRARLLPLMSPEVNEGFFVEKVILVEGWEDKALVEAVAAALDHDLDALDISVIPVNGKNSLDRPYLVFKSLGIPVYLVFDGDKGTTAEEVAAKANRALLRLVGAQEADFPETAILEKYAVFERDMASEFKSEVGATAWPEALDTACKKFGFPRHAEAKKTPAVLKDVVLSLRGQEKRSASLEKLVSRAISVGG